MVVGVPGRGLGAPEIRVDDAGLLRGDGCFETIRLAGGRLDSFDAHLERLERSLAMVGLPPVGGWHELAAEMIAAWDQPGEAALRLTVTHGTPDGGPTAFATLTATPAARIRQRETGVRVITLPRAPAGPYELPGVKSLSYAVNMAAGRHAAAHGADDVVFVAPDGRLLDAPMAAVVWRAGGALHTPPPDELGLLDSITARTLRARHTHGTVEDLRHADGVWLVSSVRLAAPVTTLDGHPVTHDPAATARILATVGG